MNEKERGECVKVQERILVYGNWRRSEERGQQCCCVETKKAEARRKHLRIGSIDQ